MQRNEKSLAYTQFIAGALNRAPRWYVGSALLNVDFVASPYAAAEGADALVIVTEWDEFRALDLNRIRQILRQPLLVDLRNIYPPAEAERAGLRIVSIGKPARK